MGGRGAFSMSGREVSSGATGVRNLGGAPDRREDIRKSFVDELGFKEVAGTNAIPTATLNSYAIALKSLESQYGAIAASENPKFLTFNSQDGTLAFVARSKSNSADQIMAINTSVLGSTKANLATQRIGEKSGHSTKTDGKITNRNAYTVTHEYGHMVHNVLASKRSMSVEEFAKTAKSEIVSIASKKYGAKGSVSRYGETNAREFFAESFASLHSGSPSAYGKAMGDWLKKNKI